jgi:hypothetical protein
LKSRLGSKEEIIKVKKCVVDVHISVEWLKIAPFPSLMQAGNSKFFKNIAKTNSC